jgi:hypothetical protein
MVNPKNTIQFDANGSVVDCGRTREAFFSSVFLIFDGNDTLRKSVPRKKERVL